VKICRGASRISGRILSSLIRLLPSRHNAVDHRIFAHLDDDVAGVGAADRHVGEQFGRIQVAQCLIEPFGRIGLAHAQGHVRNHRFRLEPLITGDADRPDDLGRLRGSRWRHILSCGGRSSYRRRNRLLGKGRNRRNCADGGTHEKHRTQPPAAGKLGRRYHASPPLNFWAGTRSGQITLC
jgi:hypothetical protein